MSEKKKEKELVLKLTEMPKHKENPFVQDLFSIKRKNKIVQVARNKKMVDMMTGETTDAIFLGVSKEVDKEDFVKIFQAGIREVFDLDKATLKVFGYLTSITQWDDKILFSIENCKEYTGYKSNETIFKSLRELVDKKIIAKSLHPGLYFINPSIFYKGDRLTIIKEYRLKKEKQANPNQVTLPFNEEIPGNSEGE